MEILSYVIIGVIVSTLVQYLKTKYGTESNTTMSIVIILSLVFGTAYFIIKDTQYYDSVLAILMFAGGFYTFIIKKFEE